MDLSRATRCAKISRVLRSQTISWITSRGFCAAMDICRSQGRSSAMWWPTIVKRMSIILGLSRTGASCWTWSEPSCGRTGVAMRNASRKWRCLRPLERSAGDADHASGAKFSTYLYHTILGDLAKLRDRELIPQEESRNSSLDAPGVADRASMEAYLAESWSSSASAPEGAEDVFYLQNLCRAGVIRENDLLLLLLRECHGLPPREIAHLFNVTHPRQIYSRLARVKQKIRMHVARNGNGPVAD